MFLARFPYLPSKERPWTRAGATSEEQQEFNKLDKNHDGSISRAEAKGSEHEKDFSKFDKNKDGKLSKQEFSAAEKSEEAASGGSHSDKK
jgi:Ca2+-binding EF-hand superfamily protein